MNRKDAGNQIRSYFGKRLVTHQEWGSIVDWSHNWSPSDFAPRRYLVSHYEGAGPVLPTIRQNIASGMTPREAGSRKMRIVDDWHYNGNGWKHGFAYCLSSSPFSDDIYEARSAWYPHGAHFDDPGKLDFPVFWMYGEYDQDEPTDFQKQNYQDIKKMLYECFGFVASEKSLKWHGEVQTSKYTQCAGKKINTFVKADREGILLPVPDGGVVWPNVLKYGMVHPAVRPLRQVLSRQGYHIWDSAGAGNLAALAESAQRFTWAVRYAVKGFQSTHKDAAGAPLVVDGIVGPKTRAALGVQ